MTTARPAKPWVTDFVLLAAIWGASFLFVRLGAIAFGPLPTAALRVGIAALFLLPLLWWRNGVPELRRHWRVVFLVGVLNSAVPFACYAFALLAIPTGLSAILNATTPLFGALVAWLWLKDRPQGSRIAGLVVGFAGVALLTWDQATLQPNASGIAPAWAIGACLVATLCYGVAASLTKRHLAGLSPLTTTAGSMLGATIALALPALWWWPAVTPGWQAWLAVAVLGVVCTGVALVLYFRIIERAGPARALAVTFVIPVFALAYGAVLLGEVVTPWMVACGAVVVLGTALSTGLLALRR